MVVEGFRRPGEAIMDGWEYFYANGEPVGRAPAGDLMYDARPGHQHWHFEQFARYSCWPRTRHRSSAARRPASVWLPRMRST